jgi:hypothetical protein
MRQRLAGLGPVTVLALLATLALSRAARAQVLGLPVYNVGTPHGIGLYADVGFPNGDYGKGVAVGATGRVGFGFIGATATVATYNPKGPGGSTTSVGATGNFKVFGGPLVPLSVTLQGGAGYWKVAGATSATDLKNYHFPIGLGIALSIPNPALAIKPWIAPRLDINHAKIGSVSSTNTNFAISGGVELNTLGGLGLHAAYDWIKGDLGARPSIFSVGAHYAIRVPGL